MVHINDQANALDLSVTPTFAIGSALSYHVADEGWGSRLVPTVTGAPELSDHLVESLIDASFLDFVEARATRISAMDRFFRLATPSQRDAVMKMFSSPVTKRLDIVENAALNAVDGSKINADPTGFTSDMNRADRTVYDAERRVDAGVQGRAKALSDDAAAALTGYLAFGLPVIAALIVAAVLLEVLRTPAAGAPRGGPGQGPDHGGAGESLSADLRRLVEAEQLLQLCAAR